MTAPYDLTCMFASGWWGSWNCLVINSNYVLLYVVYMVIFAVIYAVFAGNQQNTKNTFLMASTITAVVSIFFALGAAIDNSGATIILAYSTAAIFCSTVAGVALLAHFLGDL